MWTENSTAKPGGVAPLDGSNIFLFNTKITPPVKIH